MKFILPLPPGVNKTYGVNTEPPKFGEKRKRAPLFKRQVALDWEYDAGWEIKRKLSREKFIQFKGRVQMGIDWYVADDRDIDAGLKILLDVFTKQRVYIDDKQVRYITHIGIFEDKKNPRVEVELDEMA